MQKWEHLIITGVFTNTITQEGTVLRTAFPRCNCMSASGLELVTDFQYYKQGKTTEGQPWRSLSTNWEMKAGSLWQSRHRKKHGGPGRLLSDSVLLSHRPALACPDLCHGPARQSKGAWAVSVGRNRVGAWHEAASG